MKHWSDFAVHELLPHAEQMVLLDRVLAYRPEAMTAEATVRADGLFDDGSRAPAWLGIEYMAQTVAALGGMERVLAGKPIMLGFLLGTRRYQCNVGAFAVGTLLTIDAERVVEDQGLAVFDCRIEAEGIVASAKLNVYQPDASLNRVLNDYDHIE
ncbi:MAG: ApeP family dehydratase [Gammaproteobacteria bacterium]